MAIILDLLIWPRSASSSQGHKRLLGHHQMRRKIHLIPKRMHITLTSRQAESWMSLSTGNVQSCHALLPESGYSRYDVGSCEWLTRSHVVSRMPRASLHCVLATTQG